MSISRSSFLFAFGTILSRIVGLLRESVIAGVFGAGLLMDAFLIANRIPNMLRELVAEGALGSSFTKVFSSVWEEDPERAKRLFRDTLVLFSLVMILICTLGVVFAPTLVHSMTLLSEGPDHDGFLHTTIGLTRVLFPFIGFMTIGAILQGALHQRGQFFFSAVSPIAFSVTSIVGSLIFAPLMVAFAPSWIDELIAPRGIVGFSLGVLLGGFLQIAWQAIPLWRPLLRFDWRRVLTRLPWSSDIKNILKLMGPMMIASSAGQVNVFVNTNFATSLAQGSVTWLTFSFRLLQLPVGVIAVAVSSAALPALTRALARAQSRSDRAVGEQLQTALELVLWLMVPCWAFLFVNSGPAVQLLFQHGNFTAQDAVQTAAALRSYSFALFGYGLIKVLASYYYSVERTSFAMGVSLVGMGINLVANYFLVLHLEHTGLALGTSLVLFLNGLALFIGLRHDRLAFNKQTFGLTLLLAVGGGVCCVLLQSGITTILAHWSWLSTLPTKIHAVILLTVNGLLVVALFAGLSTIRTKKSPFVLLQTLKRKRDRQ